MAARTGTPPPIRSDVSNGSETEPGFRAAGGHSEWKKAIVSCDGVCYRGYRTGKNPFMGEKLRFDAPGLAVADVEGQAVNLRLRCGRVEGDHSTVIQPIAQKLARALKAKLTVKTA